MKLFTTFVLAFLCTFNVLSQEKPVKIVFDVTSDNTKVHQAAVRHVKAMSAAYPDSEFEVPSGYKKMSFTDYFSSQMGGEEDEF